MNVLQESYLRQKIRRTYRNKVLKERKEISLLKSYVRKIIVEEKIKDKQYSKYLGINVLNDVLSQIKDKIHDRTKKLGGNEKWVEYFKKYTALFLEDLFETSLDMRDVENEVSQIQGALNESVKLHVDPDDIDSSPIDSELADIPEEGEEEDIGHLELPTADIDDSSKRVEKRQQMELEGDSGQSDARNQSIEMMNEIDDVILNAYRSISDNLNKELFVRYLLINTWLHADKAFKEVQDIDINSKIDIPGYEEEKHKVDNMLGQDGLQV